MNTDNLHIWLHTTQGIAMGICFFSALLLRMHSEQVRSRKLLSALMLIWGLFCTVSFLTGLTGYSTQNRGVLSPLTLILGSTAEIVTTFYVVEVVRPGWLTWRRGVLWFVPFLLIIVVYYAGIRIGGEGITHLDNLNAFRASIGEFNVWYRAILLFTSIAYLGVMFAIFLRYAADYRRWVANNFSNTESMDISWIWIFNLGLLCMTAIYLYAVLTGWRYSYVIHYAIIIVFFSYINYKGLFHANPYPEGFFHDTMNEERAEEEWELTEEGWEQTGSAAPDSLFVSRIEEYKAAFDEWMLRERPYLQVDFKLTDVTKVLPMNRTYLSRLFNEGYGMSFSQLVRQYRVEEAKRLLQENPRIALKQLSAQCGFASLPTFYRTFAEETGMTPKQAGGGMMRHK